MKIMNVGDRIMNTWVCEGPDGYIMIDTGYPEKMKSVEKRLKRYGIDWTDIRYVFLTHAHDDHAGFLVRHGMRKEEAVDVIRRFFVRICGAMFRVASWYLHIGGNYHKYPAGMVKNSLRDFSPDAGFEYRMPEKTNPAVARFDIVSCPYYTMCKKDNCLELNAAFCDCDDAKYGNLHKYLKWA